MDCVPLLPGPSSPSKRSLPADLDEVQTPVQSIEVRSHKIVQPTSPESLDSPKPTVAPVFPNGTSRQPSPALSTISSLTSIEATPPPFGHGEASHSGLGPPPAKRRKLTFVEKEVRKIEKVEKERIKAEQKAKKEEEKQAKDEEQRQKNEVKEEKKRQKELEKQQKDEEKRRKDQEKEDEKRRKEEDLLKKLKAQPRIMGFFAKPQFHPTPKFTEPIEDVTTVVGTPPPVSRRTSIPPASEYDRTFLPFSLPSHTTCAPVHRFSWDAEALFHLENTFDKVSKETPNIISSAPRLKSTLSPSPWESAPRGLRHSVKEGMLRLAGIESNPIYLKDSTSTSDLLATLRTIPMKFMFFHEDIRPPYIGTYTKGISFEDGSRIARNPFKKLRTDTDYDYDSEEEWEEPGEGEDLESEGESEANSDATTEDFEGFLDDDDLVNGQSKRKFIAGDMDPVCSGLRWENEAGKFTDRDPLKLGSLKLQVIQWSHQLPIDPYSTSYWDDSQTTVSQISGADGDPMINGRTPLQMRSNETLGGIFGSPKIDVASRSTAAKSIKPPPRLLSGEDLEEFKKAIDGSPHNKQGLLAILKKDRFPKIPAAVLKETLGVVGARVGRTEAEKKWIVVGPPPG